jgi:hypothetical protein
MRLRTLLVRAAQDRFRSWRGWAIIEHSSQPKLRMDVVMTDEGMATSGRGSRPYSAPRLVDYGPLSSLTRGDSGSKADDAKKTPPPNMM